MELTIEYREIKEIIAELKKYEKHKDLIGIDATDGVLALVGGCEEGLYTIAVIELYKNR